MGLVGALVLLGASAANAQQRPAPIDPQQAQKQIDAANAERRRLKKPPPRTPALEQKTKAVSAVPLFKLKSVRITGETVFSADALRKAYADYLGRTVSQADIEAIASAVGDIYRQAGYHLTRAIVPVQDVRGGKLIVRVIEGAIVDIKVEGDEGNTFGVRNMLRDLVLEHPSKLASVERKLLIVNDTPGVKIVDTAVEEIGEATGKFRLSVKVQTWRNYASIGLDNSGTHAVGPWQAYSSIFGNSYLLPGDSLGLNIATVPDSMRDLRSGRLSYDAPIGTQGFRFGGSGSYSEVWPDDERRLTATRTVNESYELRGSYAPIETRNLALNVFGSLGYTDERESDSFGTIYHDKIRLARIGVGLRAQDPLGASNYANLALRQGLTFWGATDAEDPFSSRAGAPPDFSIFEFSYTRYQPITDAISLKGAVLGQLSSEPLFSSQLFYLGGAAFGPGYYSGDNGIAGSMELRFDQHLTSQWLHGY
jgi:hemolysin activation/secretion protein